MLPTGKPDDSPRPRFRVAPVTLLIFSLFFVVVLGIQAARGVFHSEYGGHPDEAAHYVTGLMVHDFLLQGDWFHPLPYAENYYLHYPKVALGHWPPFFYVLQAMWTVPFSPSRVSLMVEMALFTALLALLIYQAVRSEFGMLAGLAMGLLFLLLPLTQTYSGMLMTEIPIALLNFAAALCFGKFLDTGHWRYIVAFGVLAPVAILTKGSGLVLSLVPPLAVLFSRRWRFLVRPAFWLPVLLVLVLCGPWYWFTLQQARRGLAEQAPSMHFTIPAIRYFSWNLVKIGGVGLTILVAIGLGTKLLRPFWKGGAGGKWAASAALLVSILFLHCVGPVGFEARHLVPAIPVLLLFLAAGMAWVADRLPLPDTSSGKMALMVLEVFGAFFLETFTVPRNTCYGFGAVAERLLATPDFHQSVLLISGGTSEEGMFIAEVAGREQRPGHFVLRASKVLSSSGWLGEGYRLIYRTPDEVEHFLEELPVGIVVIDLSLPESQWMEDQRQLLQAIRAHPERWELLGSYPLVRQGVEHADALQVYRQIDHEGRTPGTIHMPMRDILNRTLRTR